jgi:hypothetical protein
MVSDVLTFIWAVFNNWAGYATGGIIVASVSLWQLLRKKPLARDLTKKIGIGLSLLFLCMALFKSWNEQHHGALDANEKLRALTVPQLVLKVDQFGPMNLSSADPQLNGRTGVIAVANITNEGAPSIAEQFLLIIVLPNGRTYGPLEPFETLDKRDVGVFTTSDETPEVIFSQAQDSLSEKAYAKPIENGTRVRGILQFTVPLGVELKDLKVMGAQYIFSCTDITGREVRSLQMWRGGNKRIEHLPGLTYPYKPPEQQAEQPSPTHDEK